jgi:hypothetical protein
MESNQIQEQTTGTSAPAQQIPAELNQQQALQVLVDAAKIAQSKGIFTLDDAELVNKAIRAFLPKGPVPSN